MIFVTVGTQLPFDRLVRAVDTWAGKAGAKIYAQIGPGTYLPQHGQWTRTLPVDDCHRLIAEARVVVAHAGMGSILTALQLGKPILVMPRSASLGEHRNDHQIATARHFREQGRIEVAFDEAELEVQLAKLDDLQAGAPITETASPSLIAALRSFGNGVSARDSAEATRANVIGSISQPAV